MRVIWGRIVIRIRLVPVRAAFIAVLVAALLGPVFNAKAADITADASSSQGTFDNVAAGINFWGPNEMRQRFQNEVGSKLYRLKLRLDKVQLDAVTNTYSDYRLEGVAPPEAPGVISAAETAVSEGCKILVQIYGVPKWLSMSNDERVVTNNMPNYAKYPPQDYYEWAKAVYAGIKTLQRAGLTRIDYCEVFGEPNCGSTWYQQRMPCLENGEIVHGCEPNELGHTTFEIMQNFLRIYKYTAMAVEAAAPGIIVGGPAIVPNTSGIWWTRYLCHFLGVYNQPMGYYSWHWYGVDEVLASALDMIAPYYPLSGGAVESAYRQKLEDQGFPPDYVNVFLRDIYDYLKDLEQWGDEAVRRPYSFVSSNLRRIMTEEGYGSEGLFITEWNVSYKKDGRHDTHYGASFIARALIDITDSGTDYQTYYSLACRPYYDDNGYGGFWSLFNLNGNNVPKASFNAFKLFAMLGDNTNRLTVTSSDVDVYGIATAATGEVTLLATHYVMAQDPANPDYNLPSKSVTLSAVNLPFSSYTYDVYLIDGNHSNSYLGSGPDLEIIESGTGTGDFQKILDVDVYGVVMVKIAQSS